MPPGVTAVITTYNRPETLRKAISSALAQTHAELDVLVIDDCSPIDNASVVAEFGGRATYLRNERNLGPGGSRNRGVAESRSSMVAFLDDDDEWAPNKIERQLAAMGDADACLCGYEVMGGGKANVQPGGLVGVAQLRQGNAFCGASGLLARRDALLREPFDERIWSGEDWDIYVRLSQAGRVVNCPEPLYWYRRDQKVASLSSEAAGAASDRTFTKLIALEKHRKLIGDFHYKVRCAGLHLRFFRERRERFKLLLTTSRKVGALPVLYYFSSKLVPARWRNRNARMRQTMPAE